MESKPKVLMTVLDESRGLPSSLAKIVEEHFEIVWMKEFEESLDKHQDIVAIIEREGPIINKELLDRLPNLKIVATVSAGYDHLDLPLIRSYGVKLSHTPDVLNCATAEMGMALMLALARNVVKLSVDYKTTGFNELPVNVTSLQLSGSTLGIIGMGRIGLVLAKQAKGFNMKILYHNRNRRSETEEQSVGATFYSNLNEMLPHCDYVVVLVSLTPETKHIMGAEQFGLMKKTAIFVNISRGDTVDQEALVSAIKYGEIYGAALDVTTPEPLPMHHELLTLSNVILTPHIASLTAVTRNEMVKLAVDNVLAALQGRKVPTEIPF